MIVTEQQQHPALGVRAEEMAVPDRIARPVDAGPLAVPDGEDPVVGCPTDELELLRALTRRRRQLLVHPGLVMDMVRVQKRSCRLQLLIEGTQWRAPIARHIARGVPAPRQIPPALLEHQPDQRLHPGQVHPALVPGVFVIEPDVQERPQACLPAAWSRHSSPNTCLKDRRHRTHRAKRVCRLVRSALYDHGRVARPFGFALTDPGVRLSRTRLLLKVTRVMPGVASMVA